MKRLPATWSAPRREPRRAADSQRSRPSSSARPRLRPSLHTARGAC
jgi:hypothetical protein